MQWGVRTTGSTTNGGSFDSTVWAPGTDYSQQNSPQVAFTDLVISTTTRQLTSAAHPFSSAYPGNVINITGGSGCTTGRYEILSVSGTTAMMDSSVGAAGSTCTGNLGGSLGDLSNATGDGVFYNGSIYGGRTLVAGQPVKLPDWSRKKLCLPLVGPWFIRGLRTWRRVACSSALRYVSERPNQSIEVGQFSVSKSSQSPFPSYRGSEC